MTTQSIHSSSISAGGWEDIARFKIEYSGTVRQIVLDDSPIHFTQFAEKAKQCFKLSPSDAISVSYKDEDGDTIAVDSDDEIRDLLRLPKMPRLVLSVSSVQSGGASLPRYNNENPFLNSNQVENESEVSMGGLVGGSVDAEKVTSIEYPALPSQKSVYPTISEYNDESHIRMHDVESVAPTTESVADSPPQETQRNFESQDSKDSKSNQEFPGSFPSSSSSSSQEHLQNVSEQTPPKKTVIFDMSELVEKIKALVESVTRDPQFMNTAVDKLHEFAEASKHHFEELFKLFNEMLSKHFNSDGSTSTGAPRGYTIIFQEGQASSSRDSQPAPDSTRNSWRNPVIHICTGINDKCRHLHNTESSTTAKETIRQAAHSTAETLRNAIESSRVQAAATRAQTATTARAAASETQQQIGTAIQTALSAVGGVLQSVGRQVSATREAGRTSPADVAPRWTFTTCDVCGLKGFTGPRFKCTVCRDYDLCGVCYFTALQKKSEEDEVPLRKAADCEPVVVDPSRSNGHDASHEFTRIDHPNDSNRSQMDEQVDRVLEMGISEGIPRSRVQELVVHFGGDLDRVVEVLLAEQMD
ncbi:hypothetical protein HDU78_004597 [Chytriomyces hyalinus]|nr:hypothetical protein HDU78_004197 [Chytriomyces hyalinus]KAJ3247345.1 hypothetical protein HDU78_004597 [Chytriomyces hyalinus]